MEGFSKGQAQEKKGGRGRSVKVSWLIARQNVSFGQKEERRAREGLSRSIERVH